MSRADGAVLSWGNAMQLIPKVFHQIWVGPRMPRRFQAYARTWQQHHPDWEYRLWTEPELAELAMVNRELFDHAADHQPPRLVPRMQANIARLEILRQLGGVYVDSDVRCLRNIEPLLDGVEAFAAWSPNGRQHLTNAVMGSVADHPFVEEAVASAAASVAARPGQGSWRQTGPEHLTRTFEAHPDSGLTVLDSKYFYPVTIDEWKKDRRAHERADLSEAYAVHQWASQHRPRIVRLGGRLLRSLRLR